MVLHIHLSWMFIHVNLWQLLVNNVNLTTCDLGALIKILDWGNFSRKEIIKLEKLTRRDSIKPNSWSLVPTWIAIMSGLWLLGTVDRRWVRIPNVVTPRRQVTLNWNMFELGIFWCRYFVRESPKISTLYFCNLAGTGRAAEGPGRVGGHDGGGCWNLQIKIAQERLLKNL